MRQKAFFLLAAPLFFVSGVHACVAVGHCEGRFRERPLTVEESSSVLVILEKKVSNVRLFEQLSGLFSCKDEPSYLWVGFESERVMESPNLCRAVTGGLRGQLDANGQALWDELDSQTLYAVYKLSDNEQCADADEDDRLYVNAATDFKTVEWVLENSKTIWSEYLALAARQYGSVDEFAAQDPRIRSAMVSQKGMLSITFSSDGGVAFFATLALIEGRWTVQNASATGL